MQSGGRKGSWFRGSVTAVDDGGSGDAWDPWEAVSVKWDDSQRSAVPRVSLWQICEDPNSDEVRSFAPSSSVSSYVERTTARFGHCGAGACFRTVFSG